MADQPRKTYTRRLPSSCALVLVALVFAACGDEEGGGSAETTGQGGVDKEAYIAKADAICQELHEQTGPLVAQLKLTASTQQAYSLFREASAISEDYFKRFDQLEPPAGDEAAIAEYKAVVEGNIRLGDQVEVALKRGDVTQVEALQETAQQGEREARRVAEDYGFQECGQPASKQEKAAAKREAQAEPETGQARFGETVPISGSKGLSVNITAVRIIDPLSVPNYLAPGGDARLIGIEVEFENTGTKAYEPSIFGATITTSDNRQVDSEVVIQGECSDGLPDSVQPGSTLVGCVPFSLPGGAQVTTFQYEPETFGGQPIVWNVAGGE